MPLQEPVGSLPHEVAGPEQAAGGHAVASSVIPEQGRVCPKRAIRPGPQGDVRACDDEFPDLAGRGGTAGLVDHRQPVAGQRIADGNPGIVGAAIPVDKPLHHRGFGGGVDRLDRSLGPKPAAQQIEVAPQRRVPAHPDQSKRGAGPLAAGCSDRPQEGGKCEQDRDRLVANDVEDIAGPDALRIQQVDAAAREQPGQGVAHPHHRA